MIMTRLTMALTRLTSRLARSPLARFGRRIAAIVAECNDAQRRLFAIRTSPDSYLTDGQDQAPDTYAEFLFRTSGGLLHEPTAAQRPRDRLAA
jgi:hypothetical protein